MDFRATNFLIEKYYKFEREISCNLMENVLKNLSKLMVINRIL